MGSSTPYFYAPLINRRLCKIAHRKAVPVDRPAAARVVPERMQAGGKLIAVAKVRITEADGGQSRADGHEERIVETGKSRRAILAPDSR
jgi:hypothetical protein